MSTQELWRRGGASRRLTIWTSALVAAAVMPPLGTAPEWLVPSLLAVAAGSALGAALITADQALAARAAGGGAR